MDEQLAQSLHPACGRLAAIADAMALSLTGDVSRYNRSAALVLTMMVSSSRELYFPFPRVDTEQLNADSTGFS